VQRTRRMCAVMLDTKGPFEVTVRRNPATPRSPSHVHGGCGAAGNGLLVAPLAIEADQTVILSADHSAEWTAEQPEARCRCCAAPALTLNFAPRRTALRRATLHPRRARRCCRCPMASS
jgi:hypothetical protein